MSWRPLDEWVYLIVGGGATKIGHSWRPEKRIGDLQPCGPARLRLVHKIATNDGPRLEGAFHRHYAGLNLHHEWFDLPAEEVVLLRGVRAVFFTPDGRGFECEARDSPLTLPFVEDVLGVSLGLRQGDLLRSMRELNGWGREQLGRVFCMTGDEVGAAEGEGRLHPNLVVLARMAATAPADSFLARALRPTVT